MKTRLDRVIRSSISQAVLEHAFTKEREDIREREDKFVQEVYEACLPEKDRKPLASLPEDYVEATPEGVYR